MIKRNPIFEKEMLNYMYLHYDKYSYIQPYFFKTQQFEVAWKYINKFYEKYDRKPNVDELRRILNYSQERIFMENIDGELQFNDDYYKLLFVGYDITNDSINEQIEAHYKLTTFEYCERKKLDELSKFKSSDYYCNPSLFIDKLQFFEEEFQNKINKNSKNLVDAIMRFYMLFMVLGTMKIVN